MSRQYTFDDASLRDILRLAYRHGYADGLMEDKPDTDNRRKLDKDISSSAYRMKYGSILEGREPEVWL